MSSFHFVWRLVTGRFFFQRFLHRSGILDALKKEGIGEGETVSMYGHSFDYYSEDAEDFDDMEDTSLDDE